MPAGARSGSPATAQVVEAILAHRPHPQQGFRSCLGIMCLGKDYGAERLEGACRRVLAIGDLSARNFVQEAALDGLAVPPLSESRIPDRRRLF
jgi:hypothetical protein